MLINITYVTMAEKLVRTIKTFNFLENDPFEHKISHTLYIVNVVETEEVDRILKLSTVDGLPSSGMPTRN